MKRRLAGLLVACLAVLWIGQAWAAGSVTTGLTKANGRMYVVSFAWTADASDGSVPDTASAEIHGYIVKVETDPGATAPQADYDLTLTSEETGADVMVAALADRHTSLSQCVTPATPIRVDGTITHVLTNNNVNSAVGETFVYVEVDSFFR